MKKVIITCLALILAMFTLASDRKVVHSYKFAK